jgi:hypothetical protein
MDPSVKLVLVGGIVSLISALAGILLQQWLDLKKFEARTKEHPTQVIYNKQIEFFDKLPPLLLKMNRYITTIDVWLGERTIDSREKVKQAVASNNIVMEFYDLIEQYYMYLPEKLLGEAKDLHSECLLLISSPTQKRTYDCIHKLFSFQNSIREFAGIDSLSSDLLKALGKAA